MSFEILYEHLRQDICTWDDGRSPLECRIPHMHRDLEIVVYYGGKTAAYADSVRYDLQAGDVFLTFPGQIHHYDTFEKESFRRFLIKPDLVPELADTFELSVPTSSVIKGAGKDPRICMLTDALADVCDPSCENPYQATLLHGYLLAFLSELISRMEIAAVSRSESDALRSIVSFCAKNYSRDLSLSVLEENLHLNKFYISHLFSNKLGMRFNDYINSLRISEACRRLMYSDESMTAISDAVGFNTLRTFNRAFMKQMSVSPSDYRRLHRKQENILTDYRKESNT